METTDRSQELSPRKTLSSDRSESDQGLHAQDNNPVVIKSENLFGSHKEIGIEHEGSVYRLKITKQGKLILNK